MQKQKISFYEVLYQNTLFKQYDPASENSLVDLELVF